MKSLFLEKKALVGVDIGSRYVKAVLLSQKGKQHLIEALAVEPIFGDVFQEREIKDFDAVNHALKKLRKSLKIKNKDAVFAISGTTVLTKVIDMEQGLSDIELEAQIEVEADSLIPYPINEVYIDFEELGPNEKKAGRCNVLLSVAHKNIIENRSLLAREAEFELRVMDIEGYALGNAMIQFGGFDPEDITFCVCIGAAQLQLTVIHHKQVVMSRELPFGTDNLVNELAMAFGLSKTDAIKGLVTGDLPDTWQDLLYPQYLSALQMQLNRVLQLYVTTFNAEQPKRIHLCGGGVLLENLVTDLAMDMQLDIEIFDPLKHLDLTKEVTLNGLHGAQFAIAAGLAWRSFSPCHI